MQANKSNRVSPSGQMRMSPRANLSKDQKYLLPMAIVLDHSQMTTEQFDTRVKPALDAGFDVLEWEDNNDTILVFGFYEIGVCVETLFEDWEEKKAEWFAALAQMGLPPQAPEIHEPVPDFDDDEEEEDAGEDEESEEEEETDHEEEVVPKKRK